MASTTVTHEAEVASHGEAGSHTSTGLSNAKLAVWLFLGSECLLFGGLISTFMLYRGRVIGAGTMPEKGWPTAGKLFDIPFTSASSFVLLMSSLTMVLAVSSMQRNDRARARLWIMTTALLGCFFLAGQVFEFTAFYREGAGYTTNLFTSSFFTLTGFHGVHVALGVIMLLSLYAMSGRQQWGAEKAETVEIIGLYWHFVDVVWIVIFSLVYLIPA
jgi:heme/copper-type cytochrome/quinol oxidase subunit 3